MTSGVSHGFVASIRTRQPRDGTVYTSVRYVHNGNAFGGRTSSEGVKPVL
jgi:hypothetical protein